jgi:hypothetical protein
MNDKDISSIVQNVFFCIYLRILVSSTTCQMMFVAYKNNTTGVTGEAGTAYPSRASESLSAVLVRFMLLDL